MISVFIKDLAFSMLNLSSANFVEQLTNDAAPDMALAKGLTLHFGLVYIQPGELFSQQEIL